MALVLVDAENVRRSLWPNLPPEELVARARSWAAREGHDLVVVFDGTPPEEAADLVGARHADDEIARLASVAAGEVWVVTSDRALRERVAGHADRVLGGGSFACALAR
jgi:hypothetical protein